MMRPDLKKVPAITSFVLLLISAVPVSAGGSGGVEGPVGADVHGAIVLLVTFVLLALTVSFLCSLTEAVLLSLTPSYIESLRAKQPRRAALLRKLRIENVDRSLAAILTLNTIAHTVGAIVAGAEASVVFGSAWIGVFSAVMTLLILFLSEIIPKTIGAVYWPKFVSATAFFVKGLIVVLYPLVWVSEGLTRLVARGRRAHVFSREEFIAMAAVGEQGGYLKKEESRIIRSLFRFGSIQITNIMTPRTVILAFPQDMTVDEALRGDTKIPFSRLPVYGTDIDDITGFVLKDEILSCKAQGRAGVKLETLKRHIGAVPESMSLSMLLEFLLEERRHIVIVVDEYGGTCGLVTLEDVMETLLGIEITDEMDSVEDMQALARQQWLKRARALGLEP